MAIEEVFLRTEFNYDRDQASKESGLDCGDEPSLTKQAFAEEADINVLVKRFGLTGQLPVGVAVPTYGDFSQVFDFQSAMNVVTQAREAFDELPAEVRARFRHDPAALIDFVSDEKNRLEAERLGLVPSKPAPAPTTEPVVTSEAPAPAPKAS